MCLSFWPYSVQKMTDLRCYRKLADLNLLPVALWKGTSLLISFLICISHLSWEAKLSQETLEFLLLQITKFKKTRACGSGL